MQFIKLIRPHNWVKNLFVMVPLVFGGGLFKADLFFSTFLAFVAFCIASSSIYIINDLVDYPEDKLHPTKRNRPIASGKVSTTQAITLFILLILLNIAISIFLPIKASALILAYTLLNLLYTFWLKREPVWDLFLIAVFFVLRLETGGQASLIPVSGWLFATTFFGSLMLITSKRYTEKLNSNVRSVLKHYTPEFLYSIMVIAASGTIGAYTIYAINLGSQYLLSLIILSAAIIRYLLIVVQAKSEHDSDVMQLLQDKQLLGIIATFAIYSMVLIYAN